MCCRTEYTIKERNNLSREIRKSLSYEVFKNSLLKFIRLSPNILFNVTDSPGIKLLTRLRLGLSHLREHKSNPNTINLSVHRKSPMFLWFRIRIKYSFFSALPKLH